MSAWLLLLFAASGVGQAPPPVPQKTYGESIEVRVVNVDVVVTDRNGNAITGLTKDDFEIFENGKKKEITNFLEINESSGGTGASPVSVERRHLLLFIDNTSLQPFNRNRVLTAMKTFVEKTMRNGDDAIVVSWNPGLKENQALTGDRAQLLATLQSMASATGHGSWLRVQRDQTENELRQMVRDFQMQPSLISGDGITPGSSSGPESGEGGRQVGGIGAAFARQEERPPYDRALGAVRNYAEGVMFDTKQKAEALRALIAAFRGVEGRKVLIFLTESFSTQPARQMFEYLDSIKDRFDKGNFQNPRAEIMRYNDEPLFESVTSAANAAGVTLYPISAAGMGGGIEMPDASVIGMTVQDQPVNRAPGKFVEQSLSELAATTGGVAITGTNDFNAGFTKIAADLTMYYSLGYRPDADAKRKIDVKVKRSGVVMRNRDSFSAPAPANDLGITATAGARTPRGDGEFTVPIEIRIPMTSLKLTPEGTDVVGRISVHAGEARREYPLRFPAGTLNKNIGVRITMTLRNDAQSVTMKVVDESSGVTGFAVVPVP